MALAGRLEIQMYADIARLKSDMAAMKGTVTQAMDAVGVAVNKAQSLFGMLGVTLSVGYFTHIVKEAIDFLDKTKDLSKSTNIMIGDLAGLGVAAKQSGSDLQSIAAGITKMSVNAGKDAERFRALGITATDQVERFKQLADIFVSLENTEQRNAVMAEVMGKSWAGAAPLLAEGGKRIQELVDKGRELSGVTPLLTEQADAFNDKLVLLTGSGGFLNRELAAVLPLLNLLADDLLEAQKKALLLNDGISPLLVLFQTLPVLGANVAFVFRGVGTELGGLAAQLVQLGGMTFSLQTGNLIAAAEHLRAFNNIGDEMTADAEARRAALDKFEAGVMNIGNAAAAATAQLDAMDQVQRRVASEERAAAREAAEAKAKDAKAAAERAAAFLRDKSASDSAAKAYIALARSIAEKTEEAQRELALLPKLSAAEKLALDTMLKLQDGTLKLTAAQKSKVAADLSALLVADRFLKIRDREKAMNDKLLDQRDADFGKATDRERERNEAYIKELEDVANAQQEMQAYITATNEARNSAIKSTQATIEQIKQETSLLRMSNSEREIAIALHALVASGIKRESADYAMLAPRIRDAIIEQQKLRAELEKQASLADRIADAWVDAGRKIGDALVGAFGEGGNAAAQMVNIFTSSMARQVQVDVAYEAQRGRLAQEFLNGSTTAEQELADLREQHASQQLATAAGTYGNLASAAAGFFEKESDGYKAMMGISKAFHMAEIALQIASIAPKLMAGAASMFGQSGWGGFAGVAAMGVVMAGLGYSMSSSTGSGASSGSSGEMQRANGTGTVLGDSEAKSRSIENALKAIQSIDTLGLTYTQGMLSALKAIEANTSALAGTIYRAGLTNSPFVPSSPLGNNGGNFGGHAGSVSTPVTRWVEGNVTQTLIDSGIAMIGTLFQVMTTAIVDNQANFVQGLLRYGTVNVSERGPLGGLFGGNDEYNRVDYEMLPDAAMRSIRLTIDSMLDAIEYAAKGLGFWTPQLREYLLSLPVDLKLSLDGLKGDELKDAVNAFFSGLADTLTTSAMNSVPLHMGVSGPIGIDPTTFFYQFQRAGEGAFETLIRVATQFDVVSQTLLALGMPIGTVSMDTLAFTDSLVELMGGLDRFQERVASYVSHYYSPDEQRAMTGRRLDTEFTDMGFVKPTDLAGFRHLMEGIDRTSEAGAALYARMLDLEGVFYDYTTKALEQHIDLQERYDQALFESSNGLQGRSAKQLQREHEMAEAVDQYSINLLNALWVLEDTNEAQRAQEELFRNEEAARIGLLEAQGRSAEAAVAQRALDIAGMNLVQVASYDYVASLNAQAVALRKTEEELKETSALEGRLGVLRGEFTQQELDRAKEWREASNDTQRALLTQIYAEEDLAAATEAATAALDDLYSSAGINLGTLTTTIKEALLGEKTGDELGAAMVEMVVGGVRNALANNTAQMITDMINTTLIQPIMMAILNGTSVTAAINATLTQANIDAMIASATAAVEALASVFDNPAFQAAMASFNTAILGVANTVAAATAGIQNSSGGVFSAGQGLPGQIWISTGGNFGYWAYPPGYVAPDAGGAVGEDLTSKRLAMLAQIYKLTGDAAGAAAVLEQQHAIALAELDPSLRALQTQLWGLEAAAEAAAKVAAIATKQRELDIELQRALGNEDLALAMERVDILAALDASLRGTQQAIWDALDSRQLEEATRNWTQSLQDWLRGSLLDDTLSPLTARDRFAAAQKQYDDDLLLAQAGDEAARARYTADADALLREALSMYGRGSMDYQALWRMIQDNTNGLISAGGIAEPATISDVNSTLMATQQDARDQTDALLAEIQSLNSRIDSLVRQQQDESSKEDRRTDAIVGALDRTSDKTVRGIVAGSGKGVLA